MGVNYRQTFITVAQDCPVDRGTAPPHNLQRPSVAAEQHRLISMHPYRLTSEDVLFEVHADRQDVPAADRAGARAAYFATPRACLRASPLGKRYGWGIHCDEDGRLALYGVESAEYAALAADRDIHVIGAMRSSRAAR